MPHKNTFVLSALFVMGGTLAACGRDSADSVADVQIHVEGPSTTAVALTLAAEDLAGLFGLYGEEAEVTRGGGSSTCRAGEQHIVLLPPQTDVAPLPVEDVQQFRVVETRCSGGGRLVLIRGGDVLATQWGAYWLAEELGVRYLHPEQAWYPEALRWPDIPFNADESPSFRSRSFRVDPTHPMELSAPLQVGAVDMQPIRARWATWNIARRQTALDGMGEADSAASIWERGLARIARLSLLGTMDGPAPALGLDDARSEEDQLAEALDAAVAGAPGAPTAQQLAFAYFPPGVGAEDAEIALQRIETVAGYMAANHPSVDVFAVHPGLQRDPDEVFGISYFDLPALADASLGLMVQPPMYYGIDSAAPVYGQTDFAALQELIADQAQVRRIVYAPSNGWWHTFDLPVPLFLAPAILEARQRDIALLEPLLALSDGSAAGVVAHNVQTAGQEWGYWLADVCSAQMAWDATLGWEACVEWVFAGFAGRDDIVRVLVEVADRQAVDMTNPAILRMFVGDDQGTSVASTLGRAPHPLPPTTAEVLRWSETRAELFRSASVDPLPAIANNYHGWADEIETLRRSARPADAPWLRELRDGLRIMALRAEFAFSVYSGLLEVREVLASGDAAAAADLASWQEQAREVLLEAVVVVAGRASDYRYPDALVVDGDEPGSAGALANATAYPYRVLSRAHRLYHWVRPMEALDDAVERVLGSAQVNARILPLGQSLNPGLLLPDVGTVSIDWGDGSTSTSLEPHVYAEQGIFSWSLVAQRDGEPLQYSDQVAVVERRYVFGRGAMQMVAPAVPAPLAALLPGFAVGLGQDGGGDFLVVGTLVSMGTTLPTGGLVRLGRNGTGSLVADVDITLPELGVLTVYVAELLLGESEGGVPWLRIAGELDVNELIDSVVALGGVQREAAAGEVAGLLGVTPATLPARVGVEWYGEGVEDRFE